MKHNFFVSNLESEIPCFNRGYFCNLEGMEREFVISIKRGFKALHFKVIHYDITVKTEKFKIIARNKTIVLQSNRPFLRSKTGLKKWYPKFELVEGNFKYANGIEELAKAIMVVIEPGKW